MLLPIKALTFGTAVSHPVASSATKKLLVKEDVAGGTSELARVSVLLLMDSPVEVAAARGTIPHCLAWAIQ